jgi:hypothetical protein
MQGEKNDPIPVIAETIMLISAIVIFIFINKKGYSQIIPKTHPIGYNKIRELNWLIELQWQV